MFEGDFYQYMAVPANSSADEIKKAYRKLALKYHPDLGTEKDDQAMRTLNYVYSVLSDPVQRQSYDDSIAFSKRHTSTRNTKTERPHEKQAEDVVEDYGRAVFVDGAQAKDAKGSDNYIKPGDYIYYPVTANKKIFFYSYSARDYYRVRVKKIYSRKRNSFAKVPLFVVAFDDLEQIVFQKDFGSYWLSETGYKKMERQRALITFGVGMTILGLTLYKLLTVQ